MNEEILHNIWKTLSNDPDIELTAESFEEWKETFLSDADVPGNVYNYLRKNELTDSSPDEWIKNITTATSTETEPVIPMDLPTIETPVDETYSPSTIVPEVTGEAPELTAEELASYRDPEVDLRVEEEKRKARKETKSYLLEKYGTTDDDAAERAREIRNKTDLRLEQYPELIVGTQTHPFRKGVGGKPVEVPIYEQANLEKMEEIVADVTSEYRNVFNSLLSGDLVKLRQIQSMSGEDAATYQDDLDEIHDQVFSKIKEKHPGLERRAFLDIIGKEVAGSGGGIFQKILNNVVKEDSERIDAENKLGGTSLNEEVFQTIKSNIRESSSNDAEKAIEELNDLIRPKQRKLKELQAEGGDINEINALKNEISKYKKDISTIAAKVNTEFWRLLHPRWRDEALASSRMDNETTKYRQDKIDEAKKNLNATLNTQLGEQKGTSKMTDFEAHESLYKAKAYNLQQLWATGNIETANLKFNRSRNPQLYNKIKEMGLVSGDDLNVNVDIPLKKLFDAGYDGRDFSGLSGFLKDIDISEEDRKKLLLYESAIYRNRGELELLHKITYANQDPAAFDHGGFGKQVFEVGVKSIMARVGVHPHKADQIVSLGKGATDSALLEEYQKLGTTYNEFYKEEIAKGEVDELGFTPEQMKAIERSFMEEVGEGFGHFVPMLIELGIISAATGATMTATGAARVLAGMRKAGGWKKTQYHAIMMMVEEGKMFTAGFDPGAGAGFYAGGTLTRGVTPFKRRFKWMDPFFQKVIKGGPVGAASAQIAFNLETGIHDLLGNKDFQATFDQHYGNLEFKDIIVEAMVFSIAGATHVKKTDFMSTRRKYQAMEELDTKMGELMKNPTGEPGALGATVDAKGNIVRTRPEGYEMMSIEQQTKWEALNSAKQALHQMIKVETTAIELDPKSKDFEANVDKMFTDPINQTLKSVNKEFEGFKVEFTENSKDARFPEGADGAAFIPGKGKDPGTALFLKSKFTPEKMMHEILGHAGLESYFKRNPEAEVKFQKNIDKLFEKFDFQAYDGTPLGEFIKKNYSKEIGKGNNVEPREFFAYMFELLTDPKIYYQKVAPTFFKEAKQELISVIEEATGIKPKIRNVKQFVDFIGRLSIDARRGLNIQTKVAALADLDEQSFLGIEFVENKRKNLEKSVEQGYSSKDINRQKKVFLENQRDSKLEDASGKKKETPLYSVDKYLFTEDGIRKYDTVKEFMRSKDFAGAYEKILGPNGVFDNAKKGGILYGIGGKGHDSIPSEQHANFIRDVKEGLMKRLTETFNPKKGGGSLYGYFLEHAVPWEKTRVQTEYVKSKKTGTKGGIPIDRTTEEGIGMQLEAPVDPMMEKLETEIIIPGREKLEKKEDPQQYVDMIKDSFKTEKEKEKYTKDIDKAVVEADINIDVEKPTYKGVKKEVVGVEKITRKDKEGNIIIDKKTGKPKLFAPTKEADVTPIGRLPKVLEIIADKYGIPLKRILANQTLTDPMRTKARNRILKTVNSWKRSLPDGETISGTATGIANTSWAFLYNFPGGRGKFAEGKTAAGKPPVTRRKDITIQEIKDAVGIDANDNFLPGTKYDSAIKEYIKLEAQWTAVQSMMKTGKGRFTQAALSETGSGRNEALASKMLKEFSETFGMKPENTQDIFIAYAIGARDWINKEHLKFLDRFKDHEFFNNPRAAAYWSAIEVQGLKGKALKTDYEVEFNKHWDKFDGDLALWKNEKGEDLFTIGTKDVKKINTKAFFSRSEGNTFVDVPRLEKHVDVLLEYVKMLPSGIRKYATFFDEVLGLHYKVTQKGQLEFAKFAKEYKAVSPEGKTKSFSEKAWKKADTTGWKIIEKPGDFQGFVMDWEGNPVVNNRHVNVRPLAEKNLAENVNKEIWKDIDFEFRGAVTQEAGQRTMFEAKTFTEQLKIADKYFSGLDNKTKEKIYFAVEATKEDFIKKAGNKEEALDRIEWMYQLARNNTHLRLGLRQTVPVKYVFFPEGKITGEKIKLEHLKAMVTQSIQTANLVASGRWTESGRDAMSDFMGITGPKELFDIVDKIGDQTNISGLYRMALLNPKVLKQYKSVDSGFKRTLLQDILLKFEKEVGSKKFKELQKQHKAIDKNLTKELVRTGFASKNLSRGEKERRAKIIDNAIRLGRDKKKKISGMSTFDFDETVGVSENYIVATKGKETKRIASKDWPVVGEQLRAEGWKLDFTDFNKVTKGKPGPLMEKLKNQIKKFGNENVFILTARAPESAEAIHAWLKSEGVSIPLKNITGLGNSTGEAKAMWMLEKFSEGYNDMYFVDDALSNVKAVKNILDQLDVKSKVQQALASKDLGKGVNDIMEHSLGVESGKRFSKAEGKVRGKDIKRRRIIMPDSAADMELLIEPLLGKGKKGIENKKWFDKNFFKPWERGANNLNTARQTILNDYMSLRKQNKDITKQLDKAVEGTNFTVDQAMRVYIWNKNGFKIPDLVPTTEAKLVEYIKNNPKLQSYADKVATLTKIETGLKKPRSEWWAETLASEVSETGRTVDRKKYIADWIEAKNEIFSEANLNKMESRLGSRWRSDIEDMLDRMETGRTRGRDMGRIGNKVMNYLNGSVGAIMNLNTRSATLQLISSINFINHAENNPFAAARAFANQPQYWKDFMRIMNSDMLLQRRAGLKINVTEAELAAAVDGKGSKAKRALAWILKQGYLPTKIADSFAIASGGATYLRNRIRMYEKQGLGTKEAEKKAWIDFQSIAEKTQQSSRADLLSRQQTSFEGRLILPFSNTPLQMNRIMMKEMLDLSKGRYKGFFGENSFTNKMSKITYYGAIQSLIFAGLQSGLFALMANGGDDEMIAKKKIRTVNTMTDSFLRGMGISGAVAAGLKNAILKFLEQNEKGFNADYNEVGEALLNISPTIGSKVSKMDGAGNTFKYNKKEILEKGFSLDNTKAIEASAQTIEAITNVPIHRVVRKTQNMQGALDKKNEDWQRLMMLLGWSKWDVGIIEKKKKKKKKKKRKARYY